MSIVFKNECASCIDTPLCNKTTMYVDNCDGAVKVIDSNGCIKTLGSAEQLDACMCCINEKVNSIGQYMGCITSSGGCIPDGTKFIKIYTTIGTTDYNAPTYLELTNEKRSYSVDVDVRDRGPWGGSFTRCNNNTLVTGGCVMSFEAYMYS